MSTTQICVRIDEELKQRTETVLNELGLSMSAAITVFMKKIVREQRIPFDLSIDPFFSETNMAHLRRGIAALNAGRGVEHDLIEVENK